MTTNQTALLNLLRDVILDLVTDADEERLLGAYRALKGEPADAPGTHAPVEVYGRRPTPIPPSPTARSGEYPAATISVVRRHVRDFRGKQFELRDMAAAVQREQPAISKSAVSAALVRLAGQGELRREGERYSKYSEAPPARTLAPPSAKRTGSNQHS